MLIDRYKVYKEEIYHSNNIKYSERSKSVEYLYMIKVKSLLA